LGVLAQASLEIRRFAWDLSLFTTSEFNFVKMPDKFVTGSSIMPNKRNPDVVELLRAVHGVVAGAMTELQAALSLPSGDHRDLQVTKEPLIRAFERGLPPLHIATQMVNEMSLHKEKMVGALSAAMLATDVAVEAAVEGVPFREAYRTALNDASLADRPVGDSISARTSPGGCADLQLDKIGQRLKKLD